jgi:hypothetical protein
MGAKRFGSCCKGLADSMNDMPNPLFRVEENGVLFLSVGYVVTEKGPGWFDQAVLFCPFCGKQLQTEEEIRARAAGPVP